MSQQTKSRTLEPGKKVMGKYEIIKRIGRGGFGSIWKVEDVETKNVYALKAEKTKHHSTALATEEACFSHLQDSRYFPLVIDQGDIHHYHLLIMECLGPSLRILRHKTTNNRFMLSTSLRLGIEMLRAIKNFHEHGFLHRDIKPDNFVLRPSRSVPIALIDYGLAKPFKNPDGSLIPLKAKGGFVGTDKFACLASHERKDQRPRDDVESWFYSFLQMAIGELPWSHIYDPDKIYRIKKNVNYNEFLKALPPQILEIQTMIFDLEEPPYDEIIALLHEAMVERGFTWDSPFDWELIRRSRLNRLSSIDLTPPKGDLPIIPKLPDVSRSRRMSSDVRKSEAIKFFCSTQLIHIPSYDHFA